MDFSVCYFLAIALAFFVVGAGTAQNLSRSLADPAVQEQAAIKASLGWVEFNRGNSKEAAQILEEAAREAPDKKTRSLAYNNLGRVYLQQGDLEASREAFERAGDSAAARKGLTLVDAAETAVQRSTTSGGK